MTEADWLTGTDLAAFARFAAGRLSPRRQRLLAAGFCRAVSHLFDHPQLNDALTAIEWFADGREAAAEMEKARHCCRALAVGSHEAYRRQVDATGESRGPEWARHELAWIVAFAATTPPPLEDIGTRAAAAGAQMGSGFGTRPDSLPMLQSAAGEDFHTRVMIRIARDVIGNPFRPVEFAREWRTDTAVSLARHAYDSRDFSVMPILADALQEAGCEDEDVLNHCRGETDAHVRGCWVLDGVLGNE